ncbi:ELWxxDGT repeat protein [Halotia branconii]|uniref:Pre-peptidase C-terminal domain-containing protein n=1 Tax=Halotia branconii CENA392 TaxID=1539056 RepID=A0AAJ6NTM5_9CYAN|nr:ELWxxDGT repeat protein [Halotia branconii]WGV26387.1 pre-peptidase C-terminal domain-containing protein [Halotia branconii CENA392]
MATYSGFTDPGSSTATALDTAAYIGGSLTSTTNIFRDSIGGSDLSDTYKFTLSSSSIVNLGLDNLSSNADLKLLNSTGNSIYTSSQSGTTAESLRVNLAVGTYYAQVYLGSGGSNTFYDLSLSAEVVQESGRSDNLISTAFDIGTFNSINTSYSTTDFVGNAGATGAIKDSSDYYKFTLANNGNIGITLNGLGANADLQLRNSFGNILQTSNQVGTASESIVRDLAAGTYYIQVYLGGAGNFTNYNLQLSLTPDPDDYAGNTLTAARNINPLNTTATSFSDFVNSGDDKDYYRFDLATAALVDFTLTPATANANLQLLDSSGNGIQSSNLSGTAVDSIRRSLNSGTYYILVTPETGVATNYTLSASAMAIGTDQAPNTRATARDIGTLSGSQSFNDFVGNIDTNDYYRFSLNINSEFRLTLKNLIDNADVQLLNSSGTVIQSSAMGGTSDETINTNLNTGTYYIRVYTSGLANSFYTLNVSQNPRTQMLEVYPGTASSDPDNLTAWGSDLYFTANDGSNDVQLWKSNGSTNTRITTINPGGFNPSNLTVFNNKLYFTANDGSNGRELWVYDGTTSQMLSNINPGAASSSPDHLTVVGNRLYFIAKDGTNGAELWSYNGTTVALVKDIYSGANSSDPTNLTNVNGQLYFTAQNPEFGQELWVSNGSTNGTQVIDIRSGGLGSSPGNLTAIGSTLYFTANDGTSGVEVWKYEAGAASLVKDITPGKNGFAPAFLTAVENTLYFVTDSNGDFRQELWKSDGTSTGTTQINSDISGIGAFNLAGVGTTLYFTGYNSDSGLELWKSNSTNAELVKDIWVGGEPNNSIPTSLVDFNGTLYFAASDASNNREVWSSDGTALGTRKMSNINSTNNANPAKLTVVGTRLFFTANNGTNGTELWVI